MDERLQKALEFSNYRISLFNRKEDLKLRCSNMLTYAHNGGIFKISPDLLVFVNLIISSGKDRIVLIDSNGNPIEISEPKSFYDDIFNLYFEAINDYHSEFVKLKSARSVSSIYEFVDD